LLSWLERYAYEAESANVAAFAASNRTGLRGTAMATVASTTTFGDGTTTTWTPLTETNADGLPARYVGSGDRTFQVFGTFGGGAVALLGSIDGSNWAPLTDPQGEAISLTAAGIVSVMECPTWVRPLTSGGTDMSVTAKLFSKTQKS
jgi:hypothetical protein